jgi:hypothetical protein
VPLVRIFVSSTFRDMVEEREILAKRVFPRVERMLRAHGFDLEVTDLRWGIPADRDGDGIVPRLCRKRIDEARPFFLGILGTRYGTRLCMLGESGPHSVTEDEIHYGALRGPNDRHGTVFLLRSERSSDSVPLEHRSDYVDPDPRDKADLQALRQRVTQSGADCIEYDAAWVDARGALVPEVGFEERATAAISKELHRVLRLDGEASAIDIHERERRAQAVAAARALRRTWVPRQECGEIANAALSSDRGVLCVSCSDPELLHAAAVGAARALRRRGAVTVAVDGRFWTLEAEPSALIDYLRGQLKAAGCMRDATTEDSIGQDPHGFPDALRAMAMHLVRRATLVIGYPDLMLPHGYLGDQAWLPNLSGTPLRIIAYGKRCPETTQKTIPELSSSGVGYAVRHALAADGRALERGQLRVLRSSRGLRSAKNIRLLIEVLRESRSTTELQATLSDLVSDTRSPGGSPKGLLGERLLRRTMAAIVGAEGREAARDIVPVIICTRTGVADADVEKLVDPGLRDRAVGVCHRMRRILDVTEGRIRCATGAVADMGTKDPDPILSRSDIARAASEVIGLGTLRQLHAAVASRYETLPRLAVGVRDRVWHLLQSGTPEGRTRAVRYCTSPAHLGVWTRTAPPSEIDGDFAQLIEAVSKDSPDDARLLTSWRSFVRGSFGLLRDESLDPWQTALLAGMVDEGDAVANTRFARVLVPSGPWFGSRDGCIGSLDQVTRMRLVADRDRLLVEHRGILEQFDPHSGDRRMARGRDWMAIPRAHRATPVGLAASKSRAITAGEDGDVTIAVGSGEPLVRSNRGLHAIPQRADRILAAAGSNLVTTLVEELDRIHCWDLAKLDAAPATHRGAVTEMRMDPADRRGESTTPAAIHSWSLDGTKAVHVAGAAAEVKRVSKARIWRTESAGPVTLLATHVGLLREQDGSRIRRGPVSDIAVHPDGRLVAFAHEAELRHITLLDLVTSTVARTIALPRSYRHSFRSMRWLDSDCLIIGMMQVRGTRGLVGCFDVRAHRWAWKASLDEFGSESQVMALDLHRSAEGLVAAVMNLANEVVLLEGVKGNRRGSIAVQRRDAMIHTVSMSPSGDCVAVVDRHGYCELWQVHPIQQLLARFAMPLGALTATCQDGELFAIGTEGGRVLRLAIRRSPASPAVPSATPRASSSTSAT